MGLRTTLTVVMTGIGATAICVALALVVLTSSLHRVNVGLGGTTERIRLLMEVEAYALQHLRESKQTDPAPALRILNQLRRVSSQADADDIDRVNERIVALSKAATEGDLQRESDALVSDIRTMVAREDSSAERAIAEASEWNRLANVTGRVLTVVLLAGTGGVLLWVWRGALRPLASTIEAVQGFARGDLEARAPEGGPSEIREMSAAFNQMAVALGRQREQQLAFIGGVAHDLRQPLHALHVGVSLLNQPGADREQVRQRLGRQLDRLHDMLGDFLDRTRIEAGQFELNREHCDLGKLLAHAVDLQRDVSPTRSVHLALPNDVVWVDCDPLRIEQVVNNLLSNAIKYSPDASAVDVRLQRDARTAVIAVTDRGIGMSADDCARAFEPFRRGSNVGTVGGLGLGLSVTRKLVEAHGGRISVTSQPGTGSTFVVRLPVAGDDAGRHSSAIDSAANPHLRCEDPSGAA